MTFCVYTIVNRDQLDRIVVEGTPLTRRESRVWKTADEILRQATAVGEPLPILFADAARDCSQLLYWGVLQKIELGADWTEYTVDRLRTLPGRHATQELVLRSTGKPIAPGFIRPYAICHVPEFIKSYVDDPELPRHDPS